MRVIGAGIVMLVVLLWAAQADARTLFGEPSEHWDWLKARDYDTAQDHTHKPPHSHMSTSTTGRGMGSNVEQWRPLVKTYFGDLANHALCIMKWESGGNPDIKNLHSSARGLFQILASLWAPYFGVTYDQLYDPATNIRLAHLIYLSSGWGAWNVAWRC